jgi:hypothetical protein
MKSFTFVINHLWRFTEVRLAIIKYIAYLLNCIWLPSDKTEMDYNRHMFGWFVVFPSFDVKGFWALSNSIYDVCVVTIIAMVMTVRDFWTIWDNIHDCVCLRLGIFQLLLKINFLVGYIMHCAVYGLLATIA